jgi:hypothetical protein
MDSQTLTPEAMLVVGGVVTMLMQGIKQVGLTPGATRAATASASVLSVLLYTWAKGTFSREESWDLLVGVVSVYTAALAAYETVVKPAVAAATGTGEGFNGGRAGMLLLLAGTLLFAPACGKRYAPGTTPSQAMAYELDEGIKPLRATQANVIAAVDAACLPVGKPAKPQECAQLKPVADVFLKHVDTLFALVEKEVSPRLKQLEAAIQAVDAARQGELRVELIPLFEKLNAISGQAFGVSLPDSLVAKATTLAGKSIATFVQLRDAVRDLIDKIRADAVKGTAPAPAA